LFSPAGAANSAAVTLTWAPSPAAMSYKVMRATGHGPFSTLASGLSSTTFTDRGLVSGTSYVYSVVAVNDAGESPAATPVTVKPIVVPQAPTNLTAKQTP
jgi:cellulose 1,4-beta-cellobiosidase